MEGTERGLLQSKYYQKSPKSRLLFLSFWKYIWCVVSFGINIWRFKKPASELSLFREASFGHGRLRILDERRAHWSWHRNDESNAVMADEVWFESLSTSKLCWGSFESDGRKSSSSSSSVNKDELWSPNEIASYEFDFCRIPKIFCIS